MPRACRGHHFLERDAVIRMRIIIRDSTIELRLLFIGQWKPSEILIHHRLKQAIALILTERSHGIEGLMISHGSAPKDQFIFPTRQYEVNDHPREPR